MINSPATDANRLICALETHLVAHPGGWDDRRGLAGFNRLALALMANLGDAAQRERLQAACNWAEVIYSTHRHRRRQRGLAQLHSTVRCSLEEIRESLSGSTGSIT